MGVLHQLEAHKYCSDSRRILYESGVSKACIEPAELGEDCHIIGGKAALSTGSLCGRRIGILAGDYYSAASHLASSCGIKDISMESRSPRTIHFTSEDSHIKVYIVSEDDIIEDRVLDYLYKAGIDFIPRVICSQRVNGLLVLLATEHVEGEPLASILGEDLLSSSRPWPRSLDLAHRLGSVLAKIHDTMESCSFDWCRPRLSKLEDVLRWIERLSYRRKLVESLYSQADDALEIYEVVDAIRYFEETFKDMARRLTGLKMIRIHGDLHLYQVYAVNHRLVVTDFEGEPYRDPARKDELEPPERDVAAVLRSLDYIVHIAEERSNSSLAHASDWIRMVASSFLEGYASTGRGLDSGSLLFWLVERATYELVYELIAETGLHMIPANALVSMRHKGLHSYLKGILEDDRLEAGL